MNTYKVLVKIPQGTSMRTIEVRISAPDIGAAKGMAMAQYGPNNVVSLPIPVR